MKYKSDQGVAGLTILLSLVVMLFVIGLLIMIFSIMGGKLRDATYTSTTGSVVNESLTFPVTNAVQSLDVSGYLNVGCGAITYVANETTTGKLLTAGNYTQLGCTLTNATALNDAIGNGTVYVSYPYTYDAENTGTQVINDTTSSISKATDWFDIFIVIGAMVVLVLLVVIIITSIRSSGLVAGADTKGANKVGTA